ncbi:hypothetical protein GCM10027051_34080 [Niabella terrae]
MKQFFMLMLMIASVTAVYAQKGKQGNPGKGHTATAIYTCPMHPEVASSKPGKCPKCNMDLVLSKKEQMKMEVTKMYTCPMHPNVQADKPGKCPECGMQLVKRKMAKNSASIKK